MNIEDQLRQAIRDSGVGMSELGRRCGVGSSQLARFVKQEQTLNLSSAAKVAEYLGLGLTPARQPPARKALLRRRYRLADLVAGITEENRDAEVNFGPAVGKEAW